MTAVAALAAFSCGEGGRRVEVLVDIEEDPTAPAPTQTAQGGRSSGRGGSSNTPQSGSPSSQSTGGTTAMGGTGASGDKGGTSASPGSGGSNTGPGDAGESSGDGGAAASAVCGDGKRDNGEECDDGNVEDADGCTNLCKYRCETCACESCEAEKCTMYPTYDAEGNDILADLVDGCYEASGAASQGPALGLSKKSLCADVVSCVRSSGCAGEAEGPGLEAEMCYCGTPLASCTEDAVTGDCKLQFELGAETADYADVMERFIDSNYALGLAVALLRCQSENCATECGMKLE